MVSFTTSPMLALRMTKIQGVHNGKERITYSSIDTLSKSALSDPVQWWGDPVRPDKLVYIEGLCAGNFLFAAQLILDNKHLRKSNS